MRPPLSLRLARRELRGGLGGFRIFLLCLALGVAAIAGVGSLSAALVAGMNADAQRLLGGDVELRLTHREADPAAVAWLEDTATVARSIEMRAMARAADGKRSLVELKGVDGLYPLFGRVTLSVDRPLQDLLADRGAVADPSLLRRLGLSVGDTVRVGEVDYRIRAEVLREPDRGANAFVLGPRLMVARDSLDATGLIREGSLIRYFYKLKLPDGVDLHAYLRDLRQANGEVHWRVRDVRNGAPGLKRFIDRMRLFLTLVGLTALLVGGLGVGNAVKAYMDGKTGTIAILKCIGAPADLVFRTYLAQIMVLSLIGIAIGLLVGAVAPPLLAGLLERYLPFEARIGFYPKPLLLALVFGLLTALAFALWPLARAREVSPGALFRDLAAPAGGRPAPVYLAAIAATFVILAGVAVLTADQRDFAIWFVLGAAGSMLLFLAAARLLIAVVRRLPRPRRPGLRLALTNLYRPGAATVSVILSFGLGLSVLVTVMTLEGNIGSQVRERIPEQAPAYFFIDIQPQQVEDFTRLAAAVPGVSNIRKVPSLRGRITMVNGVPAGEITVAPEVAWALRGDRGLTYTAEMPAGTKVVAGEWWPADYAGPPQVSMDAEIAAGIGVGIGDTLTVNVLGRDITARIHNLRHIDWASMGINFVLLYAPGALEGAPHSFIATANAPPEAEAVLEAAVTDRFANVTAIRVRDALEAANGILANIGIAVRSTATVTLAAGVLVLAGAIAAGHRRRVYDAVILKVLGARRADVIRAYVLEYALLGLIAALLAALVGTATAYIVLTEVMGAAWIWLPGTIAMTTLISFAATVSVGLIGTWAALGQKPAPLLRNE